METDERSVERKDKKREETGEKKLNVKLIVVFLSAVRARLTTLKSIILVCGSREFCSDFPFVSFRL